MGFLKRTRQKEHRSDTSNRKTGCRPGYGTPLNNSVTMQGLPAINGGVTLYKVASNRCKHSKQQDTGICTNRKGECRGLHVDCTAADASERPADCVMASTTRPSCSNPELEELAESETIADDAVVCDVVELAGDGESMGLGGARTCFGSLALCTPMPAADTATAFELDACSSAMARSALVTMAFFLRFLPRLRWMLQNA